MMLGRPTSSREDNIKMDIIEICSEKGSERNWLKILSIVHCGISGFELLGFLLPDS
jgi:hypothetical protein